ncbi:hypothetical protein D3C75_908550 [compost metagenome]
MFDETEQGDIIGGSEQNLAGILRGSHCAGHPVEGNLHLICGSRGRKRFNIGPFPACIDAADLQIAVSVICGFIDAAGGCAVIGFDRSKAPQRSILKICLLHQCE